MILLGNAYPLSLIRRRVVIEPVPLEELRSRLQVEGFLSYWGHADTLAAVSTLLGMNVAPVVERPVLKLNAGGLPVLDGRVFQEVWVLSPKCAAGFRHEAGQAVPAAQILGWEVLKLSFIP